MSDKPRSNVTGRLWPVVGVNAGLSLLGLGIGMLATASPVEHPLLLLGLGLALLGGARR